MPTPPKRILFVGNSYLYYGDSVHNHVRRMAAAAGIHAEREMPFKSVTISGGALHDHDIRHYLKPGQLRVKGPFEVVILQGGSAAPLSKTRRDRFIATVREFDAAIKAGGARTALYMTHAYVAPHKRAEAGQIETISALYDAAAKETGAILIPVGLAFAEAYRRRPDFPLHKAFDGSHPNLHGTYLAAAVVFASLYAPSPVGNPYDYFGAIDRDTTRFLQQVAHDVVRCPNRTGNC
ncbi:MAG: hypothetical protein RLZ98_1877 [Pseudomonadota bacterium]